MDDSSHSAPTRMQSRELRCGLIGLALIAGCMWLGPLVLTLSPDDQPDPTAGRFLPPGSSRYLINLRDGRTILAETVQSSPTGLRVLRLSQETQVSYEELEATGRLAVLKKVYPLGTDRYGRDILSRLIRGGRVSLWVGALSACIALVIGTGLGSVAALSSGWVDPLLMRLTDGFLAFPRLFLILGIAALADPSPLILIALLGGTGWMSLARLARAGVTAQMAAPHTAAARSLGLSPWRILSRHVLPNTLTPLLVETTLRAGEIILVESALSFLGIGISPPTPSWGGMIAGGTDHLTDAWWVSIFPGIALMCTVLSLTLAGDGMRDRINPTTPGNSIESGSRPIRRPDRS